MDTQSERWELFRTMGTDLIGRPVQLWCWRHISDRVVTTPAVGFTFREEAVAHAMANGLKDEQVKIVDK